MSKTDRDGSVIVLHDKQLFENINLYSKLHPTSNVVLWTCKLYIMPGTIAYFLGYCLCEESPKSVWSKFTWLRRAEACFTSYEHVPFLNRN